MASADITRPASTCDTAADSQQSKRQASKHDRADVLRTEQMARLQLASTAMMINLSDSQLERAITYAELLLKWNRSFNLTAIRTMEDIVVKHILDSLSVVSLVRGRRIIDIGSGSGFPGIAVALARPEIEVVLIEAVAKKVQFLRHATARLKFDNVQVVHQRIQELKPQGSFDTALVRSLGSIASIAEFALPIVGATGCVIAMKGRFPRRELAALQTPCEITVRKLEVPCLDAVRHAVILRHPAAGSMVVR